MRIGKDTLKLLYLSHMEIPVVFFMNRLGMLTPEMLEILVARWDKANKEAFENKRKRDDKKKGNGNN